MKEMTLYSVQDMATMSEAIAKSGLFGMKTTDQALALMLVAQAEGQHPATITQDYDIIQGRACRKSHSLLARFQQMGGKVNWQTLDDETARAVFSHPAGGSIDVEWTIEMAKKAGLAGKDNWKKYPRAMLRARCISEGIRSVYPAAIGGMLVAEEAQDLPRREIDMGAAQVVPEPKTTPEKVKQKIAKKAAPKQKPAPEPTIDKETGEMFSGPTFDELVGSLANCTTPELLDEIKATARDLYPTLTGAQQAMLTESIKACESEFEK